MKLIALSGWGRDDDRRKTADAGFDHHLVKPLDLHELAALLAPVGGPKAAQ
jgi:DNA-binding response OmpR family regulator